MRSFFNQKGNSKMLSKLIHFTNKNVRDKPEKWETSFFVKVQKSIIGNKFTTPQIVDGDPFSTRELQKSEFFQERVPYTPNMSAPATPLKSATLWGSCCLKTTLVVFVAKNC